MRLKEMEGVGARAVEGGAELDVTIVADLFIDGKGQLNLSGKTEGGIATIPSIQFRVPERHADTK
jgi:hypothetical protein